ncbi:allophanate hydrolase-related protein, partial [Aliarcobacter butzleri]
TFVKKCKTKIGYRLFLLENKTPIRPGMIYDSIVNSQLELEVWSMKVENFGKFMKQIARPLGIGTVFLEDESSDYGFLCEVDYVKNTKEITRLG